jgi:hypothetical protein
MCVRSITKGSLFIGDPRVWSSTSITPFPFLTNGFTRFTRDNSNSPRRTGLQRVFVRPSHLYTRRFLSQLRTVPLYMSVVATCHGTFSAEPRPPLASRLRHQTGPWLRPGRNGLPRRPARTAFDHEPGHNRRVVPQAPSHLRRRGSSIHTFGTEGQHRSGSSRGAVPAKQHLHNSSSISVIVKSPLRTSSHTPKSHVDRSQPPDWTWHDASEDHFPQQLSHY